MTQRTQQRATKADYGNMDWQARHFGYANAERTPEASDIDVLLSQWPGVRFSQAQRAELLETAQYAYRLRFKTQAL